MSTQLYDDDYFDIYGVLVANFIKFNFNHIPIHYSIVKDALKTKFKILELTWDKLVIHTYQGTATFNTYDFISSIRAGYITTNLYPQVPKVSSMHGVKQHLIRAEDNIVIKAKHHYLFVRPQDNSLYVGYCIDVVKEQALIIPEKVNLSGWVTDEQIVKSPVNLLKSTVVKDLGFSETAKLLKQLYETDRVIAKKNTVANIKGYGNVIVDHLSITDNVVKIYYRVLDNNIVDQNNTIYRASLKDFLKASNIEL